MTSNNGRTNGRLQRPELSRDRPIRSFSTLFGGAAEPAASRPSEAARGGDTGSARTGDAVASGVSTGYRVIEEYLQRGQQAARGVSDPPAPHPPNEVPRSAKLTERMFQYASDFASVWLELMQTLMLANPNIQAQQGATAGPFAVGEEHAARAAAPPPPPARPIDPVEGGRREVPVSCAVEINARRPIEVSWEIRPDAAAADLAVHPLLAAEIVTPPIGGASLSRVSGGRFQLRIAVSDDQPPGVYTGLIVDRATNLPAGALVVRIPE